MKTAITLSAILFVSACTGQGNGFWNKKPDTAPAPVERPETTPSAIDIGSGGRDADSLDQTSAAEREAALTSEAGGALLGETVASLGDPGEAGFWLKTPLVEVETQGRLEVEGGKSIAVTLKPISADAGAGSEISLAAMRALGLGLTDLPNLKVYR